MSTLRHPAGVGEGSRRRVSLALVVAAVLVGVWAPQGVGAAVVGQRLPLEQVPLPSPPEVTAQTWLVYDETYDRVLAEHLADESRPMASTTKMMTALVALERGDLDDLVTVSEEAAAVGEAEIGLVAGERLPLEALIASLLLQSANDAAMAIAEHIGGDVDAFVALMNEEAARLGLEETRFANPHGLDAAGHYSSARDLLTIARAGMAIPMFAELVGSRSFELPPAPEGAKRVARSTNELVATYDGAFGVKTGYTDRAGLVLIAGADRAGRRVYAVVMGSEDHFADAARLMNYAFDEFALLTVVEPSEVYGLIRTSEGTSEAIADGQIDVFAPSAQASDVVITPTIENGEPSVQAALGGDVLGASALHAEPTGRLPGLLDSFAWASRYWDWLWGND